MASPRSALEEGKLAYQRSQFHQVESAIKPLLYPTPTLETPEDILEARRLLALAYFFQRKPVEARQEVLALFVASGFGGQLGFVTILIAHILFCLSFVVVTVRARLAGLDDNLEQAAMDLYATEAQAFRRVTFPLVFPGILGAALLSFSLSFDDFIITNLNAGNTTTFPIYVWGVAQRGVPMQVNVVGTLMFVVSIVIVVGAEMNRRRREKALAA